MTEPVSRWPHAGVYLRPGHDSLRSTQYTRPAQPGILIMAHALFPSRLFAVLALSCFECNHKPRCQVRSRCQAAGKRLLFEGFRTGIRQAIGGSTTLLEQVVHLVADAQFRSCQSRFQEAFPRQRKNPRGAFRSHEQMPRGREMSSSLPHPGRSRNPRDRGIGGEGGAHGRGDDNTTEPFGRALRSLGLLIVNYPGCSAAPCLRSTRVVGRGQPWVDFPQVSPSCCPLLPVDNGSRVVVGPRRSTGRVHALRGANPLMRRLGTDCSRAGSGLAGWALRLLRDVRGVAQISSPACRKPHLHPAAQAFSVSGQWGLRFGSAVSMTSTWSISARRLLVIDVMGSGESVVHPFTL